MLVWSKWDKLAANCQELKQHHCPHVDIEDVSMAFIFLIFFLDFICDVFKLQLLCTCSPRIVFLGTKSSSGSYLACQSEPGWKMPLKATGAWVRPAVSGHNQISSLVKKADWSMAEMVGFRILPWSSSTEELLITLQANWLWELY